MLRNAQQRTTDATDGTQDDRAVFFDYLSWIMVCITVSALFIYFYSVRIKMPNKKQLLFYPCGHCIQILG